MTQKFEENCFKQLEEVGLKVNLFSKLIVPDSNNKIEFKISSPDTTLTLCYTSGTTALPKGAEITQRNFAASNSILTELYSFKYVFLYTIE